MKNCLKLSLWMRLLLSLLTVNAFANDRPEFELSFSVTENNGIPEISNQKGFDCSNQIYTIIKAKNLGIDPVYVEVLWRNPTGEIQENTAVSLYPVEGKALGWAWLKLHKSASAALLGFFDDSIGMDNFIGDWEIELIQNNKRIAVSGFNVLC